MQQMPFPKEPLVPAAQASGKDLITNYHLSISTALNKRLLSSKKISQHQHLHPNRAMLLRTIFLV